MISVYSLQVSLVPLGLPLFYGDVIVHERDFSLLQCLDNAQRHEDIRFIDDHKSRQLNIDLLIPYDGKFPPYRV